MPTHGREADDIRQRRHRYFRADVPAGNAARVFSPIRETNNCSRDGAGTRGRCGPRNQTGRRLLGRVVRRSTSPLVPGRSVRGLTPGAHVPELEAHVGPVRYPPDAVKIALVVGAVRADAVDDNTIGGAAVADRHAV